MCEESLRREFMFEYDSRKPQPQKGKGDAKTTGGKACPNPVPSMAPMSCQPRANVAPMSCQPQREHHAHAACRADSILPRVPLLCPLQTFWQGMVWDEIRVHHPELPPASAF